MTSGSSASTKLMTMIETNGHNNNHHPDDHHIPSNNGSYGRSKSSSPSQFVLTPAAVNYLSGGSAFGSSSSSSGTNPLFQTTSSSSGFPHFLYNTLNHNNSKMKSHDLMNNNHHHHVSNDQMASTNGPSSMNNSCKIIEVPQSIRDSIMKINHTQASLSSRSPSSGLDNLPPPQTVAVMMSSSSNHKQHQHQMDNNSGDDEDDSLQQNFNSSFDDELNSSGGLSGNDGKKARVRSVLSEDTLKILRSQYEMNPRPKKQEILRLAQQVNYSTRVVQVWFQNMRARDRRLGRTIPNGSSSSTGINSNNDHISVVVNSTNSNSSNNSFSLNHPHGLNRSSSAFHSSAPSGKFNPSNNSNPHYDNSTLNPHHHPILSSLNAKVVVHPSNPHHLMIEHHHPHHPLHHGSPTDFTSPSLMIPNPFKNARFSSPSLNQLLNHNTPLDDVKVLSATHPLLMSKTSSLTPSPVLNMKRQYFNPNDSDDDDEDDLPLDLSAKKSDNRNPTGGGGNKRVKKSSSSVATVDDHKNSSSIINLSLQALMSAAELKHQNQSINSSHSVDPLIIRSKHNSSIADDDEEKSSLASPPGGSASSRLSESPDGHHPNHHSHDVMMIKKMTSSPVFESSFKSSLAPHNRMTGHEVTNMISNNNNNNQIIKGINGGDDDATDDDQTGPDVDDHDDVGSESQSIHENRESDYMSDHSSKGHVTHVNQTRVSPPKIWRIAGDVDVTNHHHHSMSQNNSNSMQQLMTTTLDQTVSPNLSSSLDNRSLNSGHGGSGSNGSTEVSPVGSGDGMIYGCDQCDKTFNKQSSLARHKYEHSGGQHISVYLFYVT